MRRIRRYGVMTTLAMCLLAGCSEAMVESPSQAKRIKCVSTLKRIAVAAMLYVNDHDAFPVSLQELVSAGELQAGDLRCPAAEHAGRECDFFYFQPSPASAGSALMACDLAGTHSDGDRGCVTVIGSILWLTHAEFQAELAKEDNAAFAAALAAGGQHAGRPPQ